MHPPLENIICHSPFSGHSNSHLSHMQNTPISHLSLSIISRFRFLAPKSCAVASAAPQVTFLRDSFSSKAFSDQKTCELKRQGICPLHSQHTMAEKALVILYGPSCAKKRKQEVHSNYRSNCEIELNNDAPIQKRTRSKCLQTILQGPLFTL